MYALYIEGIVLRYLVMARGLGSPCDGMGNSHEGASDCVADPYGVKRNEICLTLYVFPYTFILSLFNGLTRFV